MFSSSTAQTIYGKFIADIGGSIGKPITLVLSIIAGLIILGIIYRFIIKYISGGEDWKSAGYDDAKSYYRDQQLMKEEREDGHYR